VCSEAERASDFGSRGWLPQLIAGHVLVWTAQRPDHARRRRSCRLQPARIALAPLDSAGPHPPTGARRRPAALQARADWNGSVLEELPYQLQRRIIMDIIRIILAILLPPLGVFLQVGIGLQFWVNILLTLLGYIPGIIHAIWIIARR
jgi:uncharacterized membrane protein YqaE (UPF0057 family)